MREERPHAGRGESWHDGLRRLVGERDYAGALTLLRHPAPSDEPDRLAGLLRRARWYVNDALEAHEHSDGRELLSEIDAALAPASPPEERPE